MQVVPVVENLGSILIVIGVLHLRDDGTLITPWWFSSGDWLAKEEYEGVI
jgi:hypothetical protein